MMRAIIQTENMDMKRAGSIVMSNRRHQRRPRRLVDVTVEAEETLDNPSIASFIKSFPIPRDAVTNGNGDTTTTSSCTNFYTF